MLKRTMTRACMGIEGVAFCSVRHSRDEFHMLGLLSNKHGNDDVDKSSASAFFSFLRSCLLPLPGTDRALEAG